jgi:DpnD/PcfM-like protein
MEMKKFTIQVEEQLSRSIEIEANSEFEAISKVRKLYFDEEIVLDENDFVTVEFLNANTLFG